MKMTKRLKTMLDESGWQLTQEMRDWCRKEVPSVDLAKQLPMFMDYWLAHGKPMANWDATFRNWMRRAPEFTKPVTQFSTFERSRPVIRGNSEPTRIVPPAANRFDNAPRFPDQRYRKQ